MKQINVQTNTGTLEYEISNNSP